MKHKIINKKKVILIWILFYILIIVFSMIISAGLIGHRNQNLISIAQKDADYYITTGTFDPKAKRNDVSSVVYDDSLQRVNEQILYAETQDFDFDAHAEKAYAKVQKKGLHYTVVMSPHIKNYVGIAIVLPYSDDGLYLFLKELPIIKSIYMVLIPSITLLIVICAAFTMYIIKKNNDFERMQREYVDNISHELKSPIASVQALTTAIYDGLVEDENKRKNYCSIMLNELRGLEKTVSDMLELSCVQNGQMNCEKASYSATEVFGLVLKKRMVLCEDLSIKLNCTPALEQYPRLHTNLTLASRLFDIILDNAIKFTPLGEQVTVTMTEESKHVTVTIKDSGPGIHPDDLPHVFARFYKSDKAHNEKGSGLGLSIAQEIANSLGEKLWISDNSPGGAEFSFTIHKH